MERMHLKDGGSIGITTIEAEGGTETRLNVIGTSGAPVTVSLTPTEEEDLVRLVKTGEVPQRCRECGCTTDNGCVRIVDGRLDEVCDWAESGPPDLCTACVPDAAPDWQHPQV